MTRKSEILRTINRVMAAINTVIAIVVTIIYLRVSFWYLFAGLWAIFCIVVSATFIDLIFDIADEVVANGSQVRKTTSVVLVESNVQKKILQELQQLRAQLGSASGGTLTSQPTKIDNTTVSSNEQQQEGNMQTISEDEYKHFLGEIDSATKAEQQSNLRNDEQMEVETILTTIGYDTTMSLQQKTNCLHKLQRLKEQGKISNTVFEEVKQRLFE